MSVPSSGAPLNAANIAAAFLFDDEAPPPPEQPKKASMMGGIFRTHSNRNVQSSQSHPGKPIRGPMAPPLRHGDSFAHLPVNLPRNSKGGFDKRTLVKTFMLLVFFGLGLALLALFLFSGTKHTPTQSKSNDNGLSTLSPATTFYPSPSPVMLPVLPEETISNGETIGNTNIDNNSNNNHNILFPTNDTVILPETLLNLTNNVANSTNDNNNKKQTWSKKATILLNPDTPQDPLGNAHTLAMSDDGTIVVVGLPQLSQQTGQVQLWKKASSDTDDWKRLGDVLTGDVTQSQFGVSVDLSGDGSVAVVGGNLRDNGVGHVRFLQLKSDGWEQLGDDIVGNAADAGGAENLGYSVSVSANGLTVAVASPSYGPNVRGSVQVLKYDSSKGWHRYGDAIVAAGRTQTGYAVSLSGDGNRLAVASIKFNGQNGSVQVYQMRGTKWELLGNALDVQGVQAEAIGQRVVLSSDGSTVALADRTNADGAYVDIYKYDESNGQWKQLGQSVDSPEGHDVVTIASSSDGTVWAIGANDKDDGDERGHAQVYRYDDSSGEEFWVAVGPQLDDGTAVALSADGKTLAVGDTADAIVHIYQHQEEEDNDDGSSSN